MNENTFRAPWLLAAARVFAQADYPLYAVGGVVRNALMNLPASDVDLCGPALPETVATLCEGTPVTAVLRAAHFGTVELHVADESGRHMAEYTTFREDSYRTGHQPAAVRFASTPEVDALRRDFSVNALYRPLPADPAVPVSVLDPTGGLAHLRQGVLHTVTDDPDRVLRDDGLRILRAARFQAELGLTPTGALLSSAARHVKLLSEIALERIRDELTRLLLSDVKYPTLKRAAPPVPTGLNTVLAVGAWPAVFGPLLPDEAAVGATAFYCAPAGMPPAAGKLVLLFHREQPAALGARMDALRFSVRETRTAVNALTALAAFRGGAPSLMDAVRLGVSPVENAVEALRALRLAGAPCENALARAQEQLAVLQGGGLPLSLRELAVNGNDLLPLCRRYGVPSAMIGRTLNALWRDTVEGCVPNTRKALLERADAQLRSAGPQAPDDP